VTVGAGGLFAGFRDVSYAFRFGPPAHDVVTAGLFDSGGRLVSEAVQLPTGLDRPLESDIGLEATARPGADGADGAWSLSVRTRRFAQWVVVEIPGFVPSDSWFHLAPGATRTVTLEPGPGSGRPTGLVRAVNAQATARIEIAS
jgi:beta-mannosidase